MKDNLKIREELRNLPSLSLNDEQKQRVLRNLRQQQPKLKKTRYLKPIIAGITSLIILCFIGFYGITNGDFFNTAQNQRLSLNDLVEEYPSIEKDVNDLPEKVREKIKIPTLSSIPFEVKSVQVSPTKNIQTNEVLFVDVWFNGENRRLHVTTFWKGFRKEFIEGTDADEIVELDSGEKAGWVDKDHAKVLKWYSEQQKQSYDVMLIVSPNNENLYTQEDLLKIANSMY